MKARLRILGFYKRLRDNNEFILFEKIYYDHTRKIMVIDKNIQYRNQEHKPKGKEMCVGVLTEVIPNEILDLSIYHMRPTDCGWSNEQHGYSFDCIVSFWNGIPGEHEQMEMNVECENASGRK